MCYLCISTQPLLLLVRSALHAQHYHTALHRGLRLGGGTELGVRIVSSVNLCYTTENPEITLGFPYKSKKLRDPPTL